MAEENKKPTGKGGFGGCLKIILWLGGGFVFLIAAILFYAEIDFKNKVRKCNNGGDKPCKTLVEWYGDRFRTQEEDKGLVTNPIFVPLYEEYKTEWDAEQIKIREKKAEEKRIKAEEKRKRAEEQKRYEAQFNKIILCKMLLQENLKDPSSFKELNNITEQIRTGIIRYSATNSFGGRVQESYKCF